MSVPNHLFSEGLFGISYAICMALLQIDRCDKILGKNGR
jgi:hypothetical protein